jgi:ribonuclease VapC
VTETLLLDTSALLTFLEDEPGADRVGQALASPSTVIPWPVLLELYYVSLRVHGEAEADARLAMLKQLDVVIEWGMDEAAVLAAARLKTGHRLSLGDAMVAAFAVRCQATLLHKDPDFERLAGLLPLESL